MKREMGKKQADRREGIVVAIDRDKGSQNALKWAVDNLVTRSQTLTLVHIRVKQAPTPPFSGSTPSGKHGDDVKELFLPFRCFCARKDPSMTDSDISFVSSGRPSIDRMFAPFSDNLEAGITSIRLSACSSEFEDSRWSRAGLTPNRLSISSEFDENRWSRPGLTPTRLSTSSDPEDSKWNKAGITPTRLSTSSDLEDNRWNKAGITPTRLSTSSEFEDNTSSFVASYTSEKQSIDLGSSYPEFSSSSLESGGHSWSIQSLATELNQWKEEKEQKLEEARLAKEAAVALAESEKSKCRSAIEAAAAAQRIAQLEARKRKQAEAAALREMEEKKRALSALMQGDVRFRKYTIEEIEQATENFSDSRKIGEGGYGPA